MAADVDADFPQKVDNLERVLQVHKSFPRSRCGRRDGNSGDVPPGSSGKSSALFDVPPGSSDVSSAQCDVEDPGASCDLGRTIPVEVEAFLRRLLKQLVRWS